MYSAEERCYLISCFSLSLDPQRTSQTTAHQVLNFVQKNKPYTALLSVQCCNQIKGKTTYINFSTNYLCSQMLNQVTLYKLTEATVEVVFTLFSHFSGE